LVASLVPAMDSFRDSKAYAGFIFSTHYTRESEP
jgi:hypothetical protein